MPAGIEAIPGHPDIVPGRPYPSGGSPLYGLPGMSLIGVSTFAVTAGRDLFWPVAALEPIPVNALGFEVTTGPASDAVVYFGIYLMDEDWQPSGPPIWVGSVDVASAATGVFTASNMGLSLAAGTYLLGMNANVAMTCRSFIGASIIGAFLTEFSATPILTHMQKTRAAAMFPNSASWDTITDSTVGWTVIPALLWGTGQTPPAASTYSQEILNDTPVIYWRLDEPSGVTFTDSSGNSNDGDATELFAETHEPVWGVQSLIAAEVGTDTALGGTTDEAFFCEGDIDNVDTAYMATKADSLSVEFWFAHDTDYAGGGGPIVLAMHSDGGGDVQWTFGIIVSDGHAYVQLKDTAEATAMSVATTAGTVEQTLTPQHVTFTYNGGTEILTLYLNGANVGSATTFGGNGTLNTIVTRAMFMDIGYQETIDEIAVYDYTLPESRVAAHYAAGVATPSYSQLVLIDGPLAYWRLGEPSGTTAEDETINNRDGDYTALVAAGAALGATGLVAGDDTTLGITNDSATSTFVASAAFAQLANAADVFSVEYWYSHSGTAGDQVYVVSGNSPPQWILRADRSDSYAQLYNTGAGAYLSAPGGTAPASGYLAMTYDGTTLRYYRDGVEVGSDATTSGSFQTAPSAELGISLNVAAGSGAIDEIAIYDYALTAEQIAAHYTAGIA